MVQRLLESQREKRRQIAGRARQPARRSTPSPALRSRSRPSPSRRGGSWARAARSCSRARRAAARASSPAGCTGTAPRGRAVRDMNCAGLNREFVEPRALRPREGGLQPAPSPASRACSRSRTRGSCSSTRSGTSTRRSSRSCSVLEEKRFLRLGEGREPAGGRGSSSPLAPEPAAARAGEEVRGDLLLPHQHHPPSACRRPREGGGHPPARPNLPRWASRRDPGTDVACALPRAERALCAQPWPGHVARSSGTSWSGPCCVCGRDILEPAILRCSRPRALQQSVGWRPPPPRRTSLSRSSRSCTFERVLARWRGVCGAPPRGSASPEHVYRRSRGTRSASPGPPEGLVPSSGRESGGTSVR